MLQKGKYIRKKSVDIVIHVGIRILTFPIFPVRDAPWSSSYLTNRLDWHQIFTWIIELVSKIEGFGSILWTEPQI